MGTKALQVVQFGKETTWGTSVAATAIWSAVEDSKVKPVTNNTQRHYLDGTLSPATKVAATHREGAASISGDFTFEDFIYVLLSGVKGAVTPTGAGTAKTWTWAFPTSAVGGVEGRTLEFFDGQQEYEIAGAIVKTFSLSGDASPDGMTKFTSNWVGKSVTSSTKTGSLSLRAFNLLPASMMTLAIDDIGGTVGTATASDTLISWSFECDTGIHLKQFLSGAVTPSTFGYAPMDITLRLTLEANATAVTETGAFRVGSGRLIRLTGLGALISGSDYYKLTIDMAGDIVDMSELWSDRDGNTIVELTVKPRYDSGSFAGFAKIEIVNAVATAVG